MGNSIVKGAENKKAKVMKITGETFKLRTPTTASDVIKDYPGHVLLESESVKRYGIRAKPLEPQEELKPKKIYFLVELPKLPEETRVPRRVKSAVHMSAKDRLECLMLSRRTGSDLSVVEQNSAVQVKMRLPRSQVEKLMQDSHDQNELAERIVDLCLKN